MTLRIIRAVRLVALPPICGSVNAVFAHFRPSHSGSTADLRSVLTLFFLFAQLKLYQTIKKGF